MKKTLNFKKDSGETLDAFIERIADFRNDEKNYSELDAVEDLSRGGVIKAPLHFPLKKIFRLLGLIALVALANHILLDASILYAYAASFPFFAIGIIIMFSISKLAYDTGGTSALKGAAVNPDSPVVKLVRLVANK